jgi:hypothetical protein
MGNWLKRVAAAHEPAALWLDDTAYCARLLAHGNVPWQDVAGLIAWRRQSHALLAPSVIVLDVGTMAYTYLISSASSTSGQSLDPLLAFSTLLEESKLQSDVADALSGLRSSFTLPLAMTLPSPRVWLANLQTRSGDARTALHGDDIDDASSALAGFLRGFGAVGLDAILLVEDAVSATEAAGEIEDYRSIFNVARFYGWDLGMRVPVAGAWTGPDFLIAPEGALGVEVEVDFWAATTRAPPIPSGGFRFATIPEQAAPEQVLARLDVLRGP